MTLSHDDTPGSMNAERFRALLARFASGVTIVTATDEEGRPHGMTVSAFASVSLDPPLVLVCIDRAASMGPLLIRVGHFGVNILAEGQEWLSRRFADEAMELRFDGVPWRLGHGRVPTIDGAHASLVCTPSSCTDGGDHLILLGQVTEGTAGAATEPLVYHRGAYGRHLP